MKNIGMINDFPFSFAYGGKEVQMLTYQRYLNRYYSSGIKVSLLDFWNKEYLDQVDILHFFGFSNWYYDLIKTLKSNKNDKKIVISPTFYYQNQLEMKMASIFSFFCPIPNFFSYKKELFNKSDKIIVNSFAEKSQLMTFFGSHLEKKIEVIYNAIEEDFINFSNEYNKKMILEKFGLEPGYLLSVSFIDERKNILNLLKAFLNIHKKINKKLVIIGDFRFRDIKNKLLAEKIIRENKTKILQIPYIDRNSDLLKSAYFNCAAHLLPSYLETPGISNLEALYFGKPILVGDCEPVREYFKDQVSYCKPASISSIENGIFTTLDSHKESGFSDIVRNNYLLEKVTHNVYSLYHTL
jgi:glycosyltransferase involved in cell wall biosynthesis